MKAKSPNASPLSQDIQYRPNCLRCNGIISASSPPTIKFCSRECWSQWNKSWSGHTGIINWGAVK